MKLEVLMQQVSRFGEHLEKALSDLEILESCLHFQLDHMCVRIKDSENVLRLKSELEKIGEIISLAEVNGRDIYIFQLREPIQVGRWSTYGIELPYPKPNHRYQDGWEHVEFVLPNSENTMTGVETSFYSNFPHLKTDVFADKFSISKSEPHSEVDQLPNPTIDVDYRGLSVKFHARSIQEVVG